MKISSKVLVRISCVAMVGLTLWFDYQYIQRMVDNWDLFMNSPIAPSLAKLYYIGVAAYTAMNIFVGTVVRWSWE